MRLVALTAAVLGVLALASDRALADGARSRPMAAHVAAQQAVLHAGPGGGGAAIHQVSDRHHGRRGYRGRDGYRGHDSHYGHQRRYGHQGFRYGYGSVMGYPAAPYYPAVVVPYAYPYSRSYYYQPYRSFQYSSPRFSIGIGF